MNTKITIKNFRVFDENGEKVQIKPLTILTGCNSSGKSTIARSALLLDSFLNQIRKDRDNGDPIDLKKYKIDFSAYPNNLFGTFDNIIHEGSSLNQITIGYSVYSLMLSKDIDVQLVFSKKENDDLKNAYLSSIKMSTDGQVFFFSSDNKEEESTFNLEILKDACISFLPIEYIVNQYCGLESEYEFGHEISKKEYKDQRKIFLTFLHDCDEQRRTDIIRYVRTTKIKDAIVSRCKANLDILNWTIENDSLFMIPIVEWLNTLKKNEIEVAIGKYLVNESDAMIAASHRIIQDFITSDCSFFGEYFKQYERKYLTNAKISFFAKKNAPNLVESCDLKINQNYLLMDAFNANAEYIDLEGNRSKPKKSSERLIEEHRNMPLSFHLLYEIVMAWNAKYSQEESIYFSDSITEMGSIYYSHKMFTLISNFASDLLREAICPDWCGNMEYVRSDRAMVKRLYPLESDDDFTKLLKKYFNQKREFLEKDKLSNWSQRRVYEVDRFINHWIEKFGIGKFIELRVEAEGWGVSIRNHKEEGDNGRLLADEGHGITQLVYILLQIEMAIQSAKGENVNRYWGLDDLDGYGQQGFHYEINTIVIEEPEIHLHPQYQSMLAEMFVEAYKNYNIHFIIETHSEYLIRMLQLLVAQKEIEPDSISISYVYTSEETSRPLYAPQIQSITINEDGSLCGKFGKGFFNEADNLAMMLLSN